MNLYELHERPELNDPVLIVRLEGWVDAGLGAATAVAGLISGVDTRVIATFDTDLLLDHRARRPIMRVVDGVNTALNWPELQLRVGSDRSGRDVVVLLGPEPDHQWRAFSDQVVELVQELDVHLVVGLGAFPAPVPHTRPCRLASTATSAELAQRVGYLPGTLDVPAGAQAVLERRFADADVSAVGLWARVPHYLSAMPYPEASIALLQGLKGLTGIELDTAALQEAARETRRRVDELIADNPEHRALVAGLETQFDAEATPAGGFADLPSGDELAAELERYLRDQQ